VRIREVVLPAADPVALAEFHADFETAASSLRFEPGPAVCSHVALNVPPDRFEEAVAFARERAELLQDDVPFPHWRARAAYFYDPGGNLIELIARERAPGAELFLEISEVGLPVADVGAAVELLSRELALPHFSGDRESFSAVGDDRGLFILVPFGRHWLFTDRPAPEAAVEVTIAADRDGELRLPGSEHLVRLASV
jgi:catechol-2,3-dioxygenase